MKLLLQVMAFAWLLVGGIAYSHEVGQHQESPSNHLMFDNGALHAHLSWEIGPAISSESVLRIVWMNGVDHSPIDLSRNFNVVLWMPSMGHGSVPTHIEQVVDSGGQALSGVYLVKNIQFIMGGDWEVRVILEGHDGVEETQIVFINLPDGHDHQHH
jgi:hypothetical protein